MIDPDLSALRDLHLPAEPGWWPPAQGYWMLAAILALLALAALAWLRQNHLPPLRRHARAELHRIEARFARDGDRRRLAQELSALLRRVALVVHGRAIAGLSGEAWAQHLAATDPAGGDPGHWHWLALDRYARQAPLLSPQERIAQCRRWLEEVIP